MKTLSVILVLAMAPTTRAAAQSTDTAKAHAQNTADTVFTVYEVDEFAYPAKQRSPEYPESLQHRGIEGSVTVQFVVDTSGRADSTTIVIKSSTNPLFSAASRKAVLKARFVPAERNGRKVKQIVDQKFTFTVRR